MTSDLRRQLILGAAKRCFARNGFAGTTTKSVAAAAAISEGLLFKHFPSKAALYAEILAEECEADPDLRRICSGRAVDRDAGRTDQGHGPPLPGGRRRLPIEEEAQRLRLMTTSHLDDGEFARLLYAKVGELIGPVFIASLDRAVEAGDASRIGSEPLNLFWFAHHTVLMAALSRLPAVPCLSYGDAADLERQFCEFLLRGIGLNEAAITYSFDRGLRRNSGTADNCRKCMT